MNELSLFTGAGGGVLGGKLLGWKTVGYVEINDYCQKVIAQRIKDGIFDEAPIFGDIRHFIQSGAAEQYRGFVDVVTAGFPCQPFSVAGKSEGERDPRNMWPETMECIRQIRPRFVFLENVPGLLAHKYLGRIFADMATVGFDMRWDCIPASAFGAPQRRDRLWVVADASGVGREERWCEPEGERWKRTFTDSAAMSSWIEKIRVSVRLRDDNDVARRVDRITALGNGQVPVVAANAFQILSGRKGTR